MNIRWIGAALIIISCGGIGFRIANEQLKTERMLRELIRIFDYMECELQYRLTSLPQLCRQAAGSERSTIRKVFGLIAEELEGQISPNTEQCVRTAVCRINKLPEVVSQIFYQMGMSFGVFSLEGQLKALKSVRDECKKTLDNLLVNKDNRLRSYQTLGICAGAAIVILFV